MSLVKKPFIKKPVEVFTGYFFKCESEVMNLNGRKFICSKIFFQRSEERLIPHILAKHMQHASAFLIGVAVKHIFTLVIFKPDQVYFLALCFAQVGSQVILQAVVCYLAPVLVFVPEVLCVRGKGFIQWNV